MKAIISWLSSVLSFAAFSIVTRATVPSLRSSTSTLTVVWAVMICLLLSNENAAGAFPVDTPAGRHHNTAPAGVRPDRPDACYLPEIP